MLITIAAAAAAAIASMATPAEQPQAGLTTTQKAPLETIRLAPCDAGVVQADLNVRYDRNANDPRMFDRQPYQGDVLLFSTLERKEGRCSLPVIRARRTGSVIIEPVAPLDR